MRILLLLCACASTRALYLSKPARVQPRAQRHAVITSAFQLPGLPWGASPAEPVRNKRTKTGAGKKEPKPAATPADNAKTVLNLAVVSVTFVVPLLFLATVLISSDAAPFKFLDDYYPPAIERKKQIIAETTAREAKIAAEKKAAEENAKKSAQAKAAEEIAAAKAVEEKAVKATATADKVADKVVTPATRAAAPSPAAKGKSATEKKAAERTAAAKPVEEKAAAGKAVKEGAAPAVRTAAPSLAAKSKTSKAGPKTGPFAKEGNVGNREDRLGMQTPLPVANKQYAGLPGFSARGEPSTPGAIAALQAENERNAAKIAAAQKRDAAVEAVRAAQKAKQEVFLQRLSKVK